MYIVVGVGSMFVAIIVSWVLLVPFFFKRQMKQIWGRFSGWLSSRKKREVSQ
jgi:hypothetical protein